jgi:hypothetical protein
MLCERVHRANAVDDMRSGVPTNGGRQGALSDVQVEARVVELARRQVRPALGIHHRPTELFVAAVADADPARSPQVPVRPLLRAGVPARPQPRRVQGSVTECRSRFRPFGASASANTSMGSIFSSEQLAARSAASDFQAVAALSATSNAHQPNDRPSERLTQSYGWCGFALVQSPSSRWRSSLARRATASH